MEGVLVGFAIVGSVIALGYIVARFEFLGDQGERVLSKVAFNLAFPAFMFSTLASSHLGVLLRPQVLVVVVASVSVMAIFVIVALLARWGIQKALVGALSSSYVNAANLGLPIATYVLGSAAIIPPVLLFQLVLVAPIFLALLDVLGGSGAGKWSRLLRPLRNPVVIASAAGVIVSATVIPIPEPVMEPFDLVGRATVPLMLLAFGMSLRGHGLPFRHGDTTGIILAVLLESVGAPLIALTARAALFSLSGPALLTPVLCSALPTAQNVYVYSLRYPQATVLA